MGLAISHTPPHENIPVALKKNDNFPFSSSLNAVQAIKSPLIKKNVSTAKTPVPISKNAADLARSRTKIKL
uniref:Uncharacterized protein n=1 Tax=Megaselia scalaris TaxID=36166 RepID=T1GE39_MEGSC